MSFLEPPRRLLEYYVPWSGYPPVTFGVRDETTVFQLLENFIQRTAAVGLEYRVAFLPRNAALPMKPFNGLTDRLTAAASGFEYPNTRDRILSLDLCGESEDKVQFFIQRYSDQPEWSQPGEEQDHRGLIEYASSSGWHPSPPSLTALKFRAYQEWYPIHNGRPVQLTGPPITIYEEVFADIVDDLAHLADRPDREDVLAQVGELAITSLEIYDSESERKSAIYPLIESLLGVELDGCFPAFASSEDTDQAVIIEEVGAVYLHADLRNELGLGGIADIQGALTFLRHIIEPDYAAIRNRTCCPCIHVFISGPYISFGGSVLTDVYSYQLFTDYIYLGGDPFMTGKIRNIAKIFDIFRSALSKLRRKYEALKISDGDKLQERYESMHVRTRDHSRLLPRPAYPPDTSIPGLVFERNFVPNRNRRVAHRALFHATLDGHPVIVRFSERYNADAHNAVAEVGFAPRLHLHVRLRGGVHMAVMDVIDGPNAHEEFKNRKLPDSVVKKVKSALAVLHDKNLVHGDVRRVNILTKKCAASDTIMESESRAVTDVDGPWRVYLVDFDQVGETNKDRYPALLRGRIPWPSGVRPGALMQTVHDDTMLEKIIDTDV